ncbi:DUF2782 domain-containing protein [Azovibrio restrictus]|uniref:DUF2782 domain-containing protein n=1 Tax=Azovibrio restrictus TaxID=146938 RepID=UPI0003FE3727|nr:DUF2782 domain-containing protein [Azovibrio restrictus]MCE1170867.1 DUF2782 domain-containing protein [Azovibrio sp.]MDD3483353.1 DUF2782 domain-containing protein [Azovibrio restrictus]
MRRLLLTLLFAAPLAWAQADRPANLEPLPAVPPPPPDMQPFDEALEPQVTIRKEERGTVQEYRVNGKLYMVKVVPAVGAPYYLVDNDGDGTLETNSPNDPGVKVPMWVIGTF